MAGTSGCSSQLKELKLAETSSTMGGSDEWASLTAPASEADHATTSSKYFSARSESMMERAKSGECSVANTSVEEQIENSKSHWSLLAESGCSDDDEEVAEVSNVQEFKALQLHPTWVRLYWTFYGEDESFYDMGELVVGEKFAEGGQAEIYEAQVKSWYLEDNEKDLKDGRGYVLKVFKKGTFLKQLKSQLPQVLGQFVVEDIENWASPTPKRVPRFHCNVYCGTLLKDERFAFLMEKEHMDLCSLIERNMKLRSGEECGPFSKWKLNT